jgi:hypothetical protein
MKNIEVKKKKDGTYEIKLNFLDGITTYAKDKADIDVAIEEAMLCFIQAAKECGKGLRKELNFFWY